MAVLTGATSLLTNTATKDPVTKPTTGIATTTKPAATTTTATTPATGTTTGTTTPATTVPTGTAVAGKIGSAYDAVAKEALATKVDPASYDSAAVADSINKDAAVKAGTSYYDQAKGTVAGQLQNLLNSDSPYMKQAEQKAKEAAGARGMLNSSIAVQAGQAAAYEAALPIATSDAGAFNQFQAGQQTAENQQATMKAEAIVSGGMVEQKAKIDQTAQNIQNAFNSKLSAANEQSKAFLQEFSQTHEKSMSELTNQQNLVMQQFQNDLTKQQTATVEAGKVVQNYQIAIENMMTDPDFLDLGKDAINAAIERERVLAKNAIKFIGATANIPNFSVWADTYITKLA